MTDLFAAAPEALVKPKRTKKAPKAKAAAKLPNPCFGAALVEGHVPSFDYAAPLSFIPSNHQLKAYAAAKGHRVVLNRDTGNARFDDDAIRTMMQRYPQDALYPLITDYREAEKCLGTYVQGLPIQADGKIHDEFRHTPKTLRLSAEVMQVLPRPDDKESIYSRIKDMFVAEKDEVLLTRDYGGLEGVMMAYIVQDLDLYRLCNIDVHGFIASHAIGKPANLSWSDSDLAAYFDELKVKGEKYEVAGYKDPLPYKMIRTAAKRGFYLSLYGGGPGRMVQAEPDIFPSKKVAAWYQDLILGTDQQGTGGLFPSIRRYHWQVCEEAESKGFITAPSGFRMWFWNVFDYTFDRASGSWTKKIGLVGNQVIAAKPQHCGFLFSAQAMAAARKDPLVHEGLRLTIHDELLGSWHRDVAVEADARLKAIMEQPNPLMPLLPGWGGEYLSVGTDVKYGTCWGSLKEAKALTPNLLDSLFASH